MDAAGASDEPEVFAATGAADAKTTVAAGCCNSRNNGGGGDSSSQLPMLVAVACAVVPTAENAHIPFEAQGLSKR